MGEALHEMICALLGMAMAFLSIVALGFGGAFVILSLLVDIKLLPIGLGLLIGALPIIGHVFEYRREYGSHGS